MFTNYRELLESRAMSRDFFFVQIGANDGVLDDPIRPFVMSYNWHGVLVEPLPDVFERLKLNYASLGRRLYFVNAAVTAENGEVDFFRHPTRPNCSGLEVRTKRQMGADMERIRVRSVSLRHVLGLESGEEVHVDLLQIDTEGYDGQLVRMIPFDEIRPGIIRFEHKHLSREDRQGLHKLLIDKGYSLLLERSDTCAFLSKG